ncbi:hypothetical protein AC578_9131 [Pseudocercospora eumusae]|uniref:Uncharacterized protein n=1 Tax=Pseudocercospora eumusae TaxID=321146 RepID=A0A139HUX9_9PEZI|nr:hypothetical protein AC578_9131 [Pseudocercospora eumusae]KXT06293.1 hypothetical protein AC578_9131 [Pseudocercospora eumusae]
MKDRALQPLAPRHSTPSLSAREPTSTGRPPRLSHRSRAGCGRKVKCDEALWDPSVRHDSGLSPVLDAPDDLPVFAVLTNDEDRERKAITQRPGTYGVVVTPKSFHDLPEYAAGAASSPFGGTRTSTNSSRGGQESPRPSITRALTLPALTDENTIILDKFEEVSPTAATNVMPFIVLESESRRSTYPEDGLQRLSISTAAYTSAPPTPAPQPEDYLIRHFRQYILPRLCLLQ